MASTGHLRRSARRSEAAAPPAVRRAAAVLLTVGAGALGSQVLHRRRNWGATADEARATLPGDEFVPEPAEQTTLGVTVGAPAREIWAWLVQIGQDRGGMYSYDGLENLVGLHIHSAVEVRDGWQHLAAGDRVVVVPEGYRPMPAGYAFRVARVDPPTSLVLRQGTTGPPVERHLVLPRPPGRGRPLPAPVPRPHGDPGGHRPPDRHPRDGAGDPGDDAADAPRDQGARRARGTRDARACRR